MTKKILTGSCLFLLPLLALSQTPEQKDKIIANYNQTALKSLELRLTDEFNERQEKINTYVKAHNIAKDTTINKTNYSIVDIVDGQPIYISTHNVDSAIATKTNELQPGGSLGLELEGEDLTVGVWDGGGAREDHQEFEDDNGQSRLTIEDNSSSSGDNGYHATHVSGTIGARGEQADAKGMAPKCTIISYNWSLDEAEVTVQASQGLLLSNHSYGLAGFSDNGTQQVNSWYFGCYNTDAANWDELLYDAPYYLMVASAGNDGYWTNDDPMFGSSSTYDKLGTDKNAKNNLVVANANISVHPITGAYTTFAINGSSSQGPTDDGRIKPDITGEGTQVYSSTNTTPFSYGNATGTSMASPNVTGSLLLLQEHYNDLNDEFMRAATLKGLVCHTAMDDDDREGPDPVFGWGVLDSEAAAELITEDNLSDSEPRIIEETLTSGTPYTITVTTTDPSSLAATICWTDPAGTAKNGQLNDDTAVLVNDLDLRITDEDENTYYPFKLNLNALYQDAGTGDNTVDTVEKVEVTETSSATTTYTITVSNKGTLSNPDSPLNHQQDFSLIISGTGLTMSSKKQEFSEVHAWPNPTSNELNISLDKAYSNLNFKLVDINGRIIYNQTTNNSVSDYQINTANLATGIYILQVEDDTHFYTQKIIKR